MNQTILNRNKQEDVNYINNLVIAVCINGDDLNKYKPTLDTIDGFYEKCKKFAILFMEIKNNGNQPSNIAIKKLSFLGKQIWLTENSTKILVDVLKGKTPNYSISSPNEKNPKEVYTGYKKKYLLLDDVPQEKSLKRNTFNTDKLHHSLKRRLEWLMGHKHSNGKELLTKCSIIFKNNWKWTLGIAATIIALVVLLPSILAMNEKKSREAQLRNAISKINLTAELGTVEYKVKLAHVEKDPNAFRGFVNTITSSIAGRNLVGERAMVIVSSATIKAGVDLSGFSRDNVKVDGNSIAVSLPEAKILDQKVDLANAECKLYSGNFRKDYTLNEISDAEDSLRKDLEKYVMKCNIIEDAQKNTEDIFSALLKQLGYTSITINFN